MSTIQTVAGPFKTRQDAAETADAIDKNRCSVYSREVSGVETFFVERDSAIQPAKLFGYPVQGFMARQYRGNK